MDKPSATDVGVVSAGQMRGADSESRGVKHLAHDWRPRMYMDGQRAFNVFVCERCSMLYEPPHVSPWCTAQ